MPSRPHPLRGCAVGGCHRRLRQLLIIGAFVFGLVFPTGVQATEIMEKLEDLVSGILVPLYFVTCGYESIWSLFGTEGIGLGLVLNTKDILAFIILHIGRDRQAFDNKMFTVMVVAMLVMTGMVTPLINFVYQPRTRFMRYKNRSIEKSQADGELRILTCLHQTRNVPGIISLLEASNPIPRSPLRVFALHLVELTDRASAMLIIHNTQNSGPSTTLANHRSTQAQSEQIISAFEDLEQRNLAVSVQSLTVMSPYATMDEDICSIAEDKRVALTIIPFHKQQTADGQMEEGDAAVRRVNQNVLANTSCSVAIFVDRGFGALDYQDRRICMLFFCGPDDREALSYSWRMVGHPTAMLAVIRFIPSENAADLETLEEYVPGDSNGILSAISEYEKQKSLDDEFVENFRIRTSGDENILYREVVLNNGEEAVTAIREMDHNYDLYVVGRGQKVLSPLTAGLNEWSDCPELGAIGDILVTSEFASSASVLVIQQFEGAAGLTVSESGSSDGSLNGGDTKGFEHSNWRQAGEDGGFDPFVRSRGVQNGWHA
ncbi:Cation/H(+) antiporter 15 [Vitis vinifera]|uniref:Cation/H(+) antiporter 15 n=1 Tax=Vitis vinifera TaxID=29760 RepID=A0A438JP54_VITVI|nr:Cation/H(+) antiporter 15 [Vitis vinifera]